MAEYMFLRYIGEYDYIKIKDLEMTTCFLMFHFQVQFCSFIK